MNKFLNEDYWQIATPESIKRDIDQGAVVDSRNQWGETPLMFAAKRSINIEVIKTLIENGADVNDCTVDDKTALMMACYYNPNPEIVTTLIDHGANIDAQDSNRQTPLIWACRFENLEAISLLLEAGADVDLVDNFSHGAWWYLDNCRHLHDTPVYKLLMQKVQALYTVRDIG